MSDDVLLADQVFQLNALLWALEELPDKGEIQPVLRQAGYYLGAIERRVVMPTDEESLAALAKLIGTADRSPCHPDLWLRHSTDPIQPLIELKSQGFSPDSSNRRQALKLLAAASDLAPSLAEIGQRPGHVVYATVATDAGRIASTLDALATELNAEGVASAPTGAIGLAIETGGVSLSSPQPADLPPPLGSSLSNRPIVLRRDGDNDLQPLYFVPWIPGIEDSQNAELHSAGLRELTARILVYMQAAIGQALPPTALTLDGSRLLSDATFGVFDKWRNADKQKFGDAVGKIVDRTLGSVVGVRRVSKGSREIDLPDLDKKEEVIARIEQADPADPSSNLKAAIEDPPTLFDDSQ